MEEDHPAHTLASVYESISILYKGEDKLVLIDGRRLFVPEGYRLDILTLLHKDHGGEEDDAENVE